MREKTTERHGFKLGEKVLIIDNTGVIEGYDEFIGSTADIIKIYPNEYGNEIEYCFMLDIDKFKKQGRKSKKRFPTFLFSKNEIQHLEKSLEKNILFDDGYYSLNYGISFEYFVKNLDKGKDFLIKNNFITKI